MELFGFAFTLIVGLAFVVPGVFILGVPFVYTRVHRGLPVNIETGASIYTVIIIGIGAIVLTAGVARLLTAGMAEIDSDYTYGQSVGDVFNDGGVLDESISDRQQDEDIASGLALIAAGALAIATHIILRGVLLSRAHFDRGVEGAWDVLVTVLVGAILLVVIAAVLDGTLSRAIVDETAASPGDTIAQMFAIIGLWLVYAYRSAIHVGLWQDAEDMGPAAGAEV